MSNSCRTIWNGAASLLAGSRILSRGGLRSTKVELRIHPDAYVSPGVKVEVGGPGAVRLWVGPGCRLERGSMLRLSAGADVMLARDVLIRSTAILNIAGELEMRGRNLLSWGSVIHCAEQVTFDEMAGTGEGVTVVDGSHYRLGEDDHWYGRSATAPVFIGRNVWLASKATVTKGVDVGPAATVAANSLVVKDVPPGALVMGVPARVVRIGSGRSRLGVNEVET